MKSQTAVFEQVLMFTIGVSIFIIYLAVFNIYQNYYIDASSNDQLTEVKSLITSHIEKMILLDEPFIRGATDNTVNATYLITIPRHIGNQIYKIDLSNEGINISSIGTRASKSSSLLNLNETYTFNGRVISGSGKLTIIKRGTEIKII